MSEAPRFSIVMAAYNAEAYITDAVLSTLVQTVPDLEVVIVDDGSTDATAELAADLEDRRVRVICQSHAGVSAARNAGMTSVRGDYVLFLDADDRLRPDALERLGAVLDGHSHICAAYGDWLFVSQSGIPLGPETKPRFTPRPSGIILQELLRNSFMIAVGSVCVRAEYLRRAGPWGDYRLGEDWEYWCRLATHGEFQYIGEGPVLEYRLHDQSTVRRAVRNMDDVFRVIDTVFASEAVRQSIPEATLMRLKRKREAVACAFATKHFVTAGRWMDAIRYACRGVWLDLRNPADLILPGVVASTIERRFRTL